MDDKLRDLERAWQSSGTHLDLVRLLRARLRAGLDPARLNIAAGLLHPAAQEALGLPVTTRPPGILRLGKDKKIRARDVPQCLGQMWDYDADRFGYGPGNFQVDIRLDALRIMSNTLMQLQIWMLRRARMMFGISPDASGSHERIENLQNMIDQAIEHQYAYDWHRILDEMGEIIDDFRGALVQLKPPPYDYDDANAELREKLLSPVFEWSLGDIEARGDSVLPDFSTRRRPRRKRRNPPSFDEAYRIVERQASSGDQEAEQRLNRLRLRMGAPELYEAPPDEEPIDPTQEYDDELSRGCSYDCIYSCQHVKPEEV